MLFVSMLAILAYHSNFGITRRAPELIFCSVVSGFGVCALVSFFLSAIFGVSVGFSSGYAGVEEIRARGILIPLPKSVHNSVHYVGFSGLCRIVLFIL